MAEPSASCWALLGLYTGSVSGATIKSKEPPNAKDKDCCISLEKAASAPQYLASPLSPCLCPSGIFQTPQNPNSRNPNPRTENRRHPNASLPLRQRTQQQLRGCTSTHSQSLGSQSKSELSAIENFSMSSLSPSRVHVSFARRGR